MSTTQDAPRDAELMRQVADGSGEALAMLHDLATTEATSSG